MIQHEMIRSKMKSATIATRITRMIGMMPDEFLIIFITNPPDIQCGRLNPWFPQCSSTRTPSCLLGSGLQFQNDSSAR